MEAALRKLLPDADRLDILPAFQGGGDLHIARVTMKKDAPRVVLPLGKNGIHGAKFYSAKNGIVTGRIHFHASELPKIEAAKTASNPPQKTAAN